MQIFVAVLLALTFASGVTKPRLRQSEGRHWLFDPTIIARFLGRYNDPPERPKDRWIAAFSSSSAGF